MNETRLQQILDQYSSERLLVIGDFFLDNYLILQRSLSEISLETGLEAYQVVNLRKYPGAAGTVAANIRAQDGEVVVLGVLGEDGNGYELRKKLVEIGADTSALVVDPGLFTPTYIKPMMNEPDGKVHELNRMDIKNRSPLPERVEDEIINRLKEIVPDVQGVIIVDQVQERNCGVVTDRVRSEIERLAQTYPKKTFITDSRVRAHLFQGVILKMNLSEAITACGLGQYTSTADLSAITTCCERLFKRTNKQIFITRGEEGCVLFTQPGTPLLQVPPVPVDGQIDIVGAGDSFLASLSLALCSGAELDEAALIGNLAASIVIQQIGITGTANRAQISSRFLEFNSRSV